MYFIPQKNRWYSVIVHTSPLYRYSITCFMLALVLVGWRYGLHVWLNTMISNEQVERIQLQQQHMQLMQAERTNAYMSKMVPELQKQLRAYNQPDSEVWQQQQCEHVMNEAQKAGLHITSYADGKEKKKSWGLHRSVQLGLRGSFDRINTFFNVLKQSPYMIQCTQIQGSRTDGDQFSVSCNLKFMTACV